MELESKYSIRERRQVKDRYSDRGDGDVALKDGFEVKETEIQGIMFRLNRLKDEDPAVFKEFINACRNTDIVPSLGATAKLEAFSFLKIDYRENGWVHSKDQEIEIIDKVRHVVNSAVTGSLSSLKVEDPRMDLGS